MKKENYFGEASIIEDPKKKIKLEIRDGSVVEKKVADGAITEKKIRNGSVTTDKIRRDSVTTETINDSAVTTDKINNNAVTSEKIVEGAVSVGKIKDLAVVESKIGDKAVTNIKIGDAAVDTRIIKDKSVTNEKLANESVTKEKIFNSSVTTEKIANESVSAEKLQSSLRNTIVTTRDKTIELNNKKADITDVGNAIERLENKIGERITVEGNVTNLPDEEDLTSISTLDGREVMKLNDRVYEPSNFSGKGYKILRKNIKKFDIPTVNIVVSYAPTSSGDITITVNDKVTTINLDSTIDTTTAIVATKIAATLKSSLDDYDVSVSSNRITLTRHNDSSVSPSSINVGNTSAVITVTDGVNKNVRKNVLTKDMIDKPNTIYEIKYDFDLCGHNISIPQGVFFKFEGGLFKNGSFTCTYTEIQTNCECFDNIQLHGTIANHTINIDWWVMPIEIDKYYAYQLNSLVKLKSNNTILFGDKTYKAITDELIIYDGISISGHNTTALYLYSQNKDSKFYIGISKKCSISNLLIYVYEKRNISILYAESTMTYTNHYVSDWKQTIKNINITNLQYFSENSQIKDIKTIGIFFNISRYNYKGELIDGKPNYSFSYKGNYKSIKIKYFDTGIKLYVDNDNNPNVWCTSVHFYNTEFWTEKGFDIQGKAAWRILIEDYLYQIVANSIIQAPIYGDFGSLLIKGMIVWDAVIRGIANGIIFDDSAYNYNTNNYHSYNGYKKLDNDKDLIVYNTPPLSNNIAFLSSGKTSTINTLQSYYSGAQLLIGHNLKYTKDSVGSFTIQDMKKSSDSIEAFKVSVDYDSTYNKNKSYTLYYKNGDVVQFNKGKKRQINNIFSDNTFTQYCVGDILYDNDKYNYLFKGNNGQLNYFDTYDYCTCKIGNEEIIIGNYRVLGNSKTTISYSFYNTTKYISGILLLKITFNAGKVDKSVSITPTGFYTKTNVLPNLKFKVYFKIVDTLLYVRLAVEKKNGDTLNVSIKTTTTLMQYNINDTIQLDTLTEVNVPIYLSKDNPNSLGETRFYDNNLHFYDGEKFLKLKAIEDCLDKGNSGQRPADVTEGFQYYDTTLKKYIVWTGTEWTNMDGTALG